LSVFLVAQFVSARLRDRHGAAPLVPRTAPGELSGWNKGVPMSDPTAAAPQGESAPAPAAEAPTSFAQTLDEDVVRAALRRVKDPELNLNIVDLGLVYGIAVEGPKVVISMSLTSPGCPSGPEIMTAAEQQVRALEGVEEVAVNLVWDPMWSPERIEPRIRAYMGF
jgi:metal-sulfur cluster biosynthetic enzyme